MRALAAVRRVIVAVTIATVVMVVLFLALVFDIDFGAELDIGVDFRVFVFLDIDVTVHDGAVVIAIDVHVSSVAHATLAVSLAAAAAAGGLALFADVLDAAGQVLADGGHDGVDRHDGPNGFHEDLEDRLNEADPLGDLTGDLRFGDGSCDTSGEDNLHRCGNTAANNIADGAHDSVVDAIDGVRHLSECLAKGTRRGRDAVDRTGDDGLALQVRAHCLTLHARHRGRRSGLQLFSNGGEGARDGVPAGAHAVHLSRVAGQLVHPGLEGIDVLQDPLDCHTDDTADRVNGEPGCLLVDCLR